MPTQCCQTLSELIDDDDTPVVYSPRYREWSLILLDVDRNPDPDDEPENWRTDLPAQNMAYCPYCRHEFPPSLRSERFEVLWEQGIDSGCDPVPKEFETDQWWKERGL